MNGIDEAKKIRAKFASVVEFIIKDDYAMSIAGDRLEWDDLEIIPEWYMWDEDKFKHLVLVAGTVFLLPTIRLWIEATKINHIQSIISKPVYEYIIQYTHVDHLPEQQLEINDLQNVIEEAGASIILSSQEKRLHPWLKSKIPEAKERLEKNVATELMKHTIFVLENMKSIVEEFQGKDQGKGQANS